MLVKEDLWQDYLVYVDKTTHFKTRFQDFSAVLAIVFPEVINTKAHIANRTNQSNNTDKRLYLLLTYQLDLSFTWILHLIYDIIVMIKYGKLNRLWKTKNPSFLGY